MASLFWFSVTREEHVSDRIYEYLCVLRVFPSPVGKIGSGTPKQGLPDPTTQLTQYEPDPGN